MSGDIGTKVRPKPFQMLEGMHTKINTCFIFKFNTNNIEKEEDGVFTPRLRLLFGVN